MLRISYEGSVDIILTNVHELISVVYCGEHVSQSLIKFCLPLQYRQGKTASYEFGEYVWENDAFEMDWHTLPGQEISKTRLGKVDGEWTVSKWTWVCVYVYVCVWQNQSE